MLEASAKFCSYLFPKGYRMSLVVVWDALALIKSILALAGAVVLLLQMDISSPVVRVHGSLCLLSHD